MPLPFDVMSRRQTDAQKAREYPPRNEPAADATWRTRVVCAWQAFRVERAMMGATGRVDSGRPSEWRYVMRCRGVETRMLDGVGGNVHGCV